MRLIFEWDRNKADSNFRKHKILFDEAKTIYSDESLMTFADEFHSTQEDRFISIGLSNRSRILLVAHTEVNEAEGHFVIRIISCRKATLSERKIYDQKKR